MPDERYKIIHPVPGGNQWFYLIDTRSETEPNKQLAQLFSHVPGALSAILKLQLHLETFGTFNG